MSKTDESKQNPDGSGATVGLRKHWHRAIHTEDRMTQIRLETLIEALASAALRAADSGPLAEGGVG
ncbi:MAG: hypothetical protein ACLFWB_08885 [Armatimonadota bacterium]